MLGNSAGIISSHIIGHTGFFYEYNSWESWVNVYVIHYTSRDTFPKIPWVLPNYVQESLILLSLAPAKKKSRLRVRDSLLPHSNILGQDMNPEVGNDGSQEMYITFASTMQIRQNPL